MYKYKIGYADYDDSEFVELEHEEKFTKDELTTMIGLAVVAAVRDFKADDDEYVHGFNDVMNHGSMCGHLMLMYGFKPVRYEVCWEALGHVSLFDEAELADWQLDGEAGRNTLELIRMVNGAGFSRKDDSYLERLGRKDK